MINFGNSVLKSGDIMITLQDFLDFLQKQEELRDFLLHKCEENHLSYKYNLPNYHILKEDYSDWELENDKIIVYFEENRREPNNYHYELPPDILFEVDFQGKMSRYR